MDKSQLLVEVQAFIKEKIVELPFHNYKHTEGVVHSVIEISSEEGISKNDTFLLQLAAWFHDMGHTATKCSGHETDSAVVADKYLKGKISPEELETVKACVFATQLFRTPNNKLEEIICDADLLHLGKDDFYTLSENLRLEKTEIESETNFTKKEWLVMNLQFLYEHKYRTTYAREKYQPIKKLRIQEIQDKINALLTKKGKEKKVSNPEATLATSPQKPRRDIETMLTIQARNQMGLSAIADRKASILLSINTMITSFAIGFLFRKIDKYPELEIPSYLFAITGLICVILAVLATRPKIGSPQVTDEEIKARKVNLLFFENFINMPLKDYQDALIETNKTPDEVYESLSRDSYYLGQVLAVKYKRIRLAFNVFMTGLTITVISFIISFSLS